MGMSATQARYLSLIAQQSNLEYQGQQINQERSILSQQVSELYNSLLALDVPTPPSTSDFTQVKYTGISGTTAYSFEPCDVKPGSNGLYTITLKYTKYGESLNKNNGYQTTKNEAEVIGYDDITTTITKDDSTTDKTYTSSQLNGIYVKVEDENGVESLKPCRLVKDAVQSTGDGKFTLNRNNSYVIKNPSSSNTMPVSGGVGYTIAGKTAYTLDSSSVPNPDELAGYHKAIENSGLKKADGNSYTADDFYVYFDDSGNIHFALQAEVKKASAEKDNTTVTYDFVVTGAFTQNEENDNCKITFDPSSGRITSIDIPSSKDANGEVLSYTTINMEATTITDDVAYKDAYAQYEYKQYEYDKMQQEINAKTEVIQQQDRNLELRLQRLDTQRQQITAEVESLKSVLKDNIESSYKTFSG